MGRGGADAGASGAAGEPRESVEAVASRRLDPHLTLISDGGHVISYREDAQGHPFIDVWRLVVADIPEGEEEDDGWE